MEEFSQRWFDLEIAICLGSSPEPLLDVHSGPLPNSLGPPEQDQSVARRQDRRSLDVCKEHCPHTMTNSYEPEPCWIDAWKLIRKQCSGDEPGSDLPNHLVPQRRQPLTGKQFTTNKLFTGPDMRPEIVNNDESDPSLGHPRSHA